MSDLQSFFVFAQAFELAYYADDFAMLEPFFTEDAVRRVRNGGSQDRDDVGRAAVIDGLRRATHEFERRFDARIPEIVEGPVTREDGVWMRFRLTACREGIDDVSIEGDHLVRLRGGKISAIEERLLGDSAARMDAALRDDAKRLRQVGSRPLPPRGLDAKRLERATMRSLVRCYGSAKSEQDAGAALAVCHPSFTIDTLPFGIASRDREETAAHLAVFFETFPDYRVALEGVAVQGESVATWGSASMTLAGVGLGVAPTGKAAEIPIACIFDFRDGLIARERFLFDLATLCRGLGVEIANVERSLAAFRAAAAA